MKSLDKCKMIAVYAYAMQYKFMSNHAFALSIFRSNILGRMRRLCFGQTKQRITFLVFSKLDQIIEMKLLLNR